MRVTGSLPVLLALFLAAPLAAQDEPLPAWTILVYVSGDCDLEAFAVGDLEEMARAKPSAAVRVVVQIDRAEADEPEGQYSAEPVGDLDDFTSTKRLVVEGGRIHEVEDLGETNTGDPEVLAGFVAWGLERFPAERTALVLWDHGAGWPGYGGDDSHDGDSLTLPELAAALEAAAGEVEGDDPPLAWIGFDCCLMATLEVMAACAPFAPILVASEELEPGFGWDYTAWLTALAADPGMATEDLAVAICDSYKSFFDENPDPEIRAQGGSITLSAVHLDGVGAIVEAVEEMTGALAAALEENGREAWLELARARARSEEYGRSGEEEGTHHHDLHHLARRLEAAGLETAAVRQAIEAAVFHRVAGRDRPHARGISVYFPPEASASASEGSEPSEYEAATFSEVWAGFLSVYVSIEAQDEDAPRLTDLGASTSSIGEGEAATLEVTVEGDDLDGVYFVLGERSGDVDVILGMIPLGDEAGRYEAEFDGTWLALGGEKGEYPAPIESYEEVEDEVAIVGIPALYHPPRGREPIRVTLYFRLDLTGEELETEFVYAYRYTGDGPAEIRLRRGGRIQPVYLVVDEDGQTEEAPLQDDGFEVGDGGLDLVEVSLSAGEYLVGFLAEDLAGNAGESLTRIEVK